jgi:hypothetical protein
MRRLTSPRVVGKDNLGVRDVPQGKQFQNAARSCCISNGQNFEG